MIKNKLVNIFFLIDDFFSLFLLDKQTADQIGKILKEMPEYNYATLKFLFKHFKFIEKYQDENLMNSGKFIGPKKDFFFLRKFSKEF